MNKSWQDAAAYAVSSIYEMSVVNGLSSVDNLVKFMRYRFDQTLRSIDNYNYVPPAALVTDEGYGLWNFVGRHALNILTVTGNRPDQEELLATLIRKQKDYGPENIARFGNIGLLIRMHDKIARLENLLAKSSGDFNAAVNVNTVSNETVVDTLIDIIGYSAIAIMWSSIDEDGDRAFLYKMGE